MNMIVRAALFFAILICLNCEPLRTQAPNEAGNGSDNAPHIEQIDIDKELQKEVNTLESRLEFVENTLQNFQNNYNALKENFNSLKTNYNQATMRIQQLENLTHQTVMDLHDQSSKYFTLESINSNLQKTVDNTNVRLDDKTSALWTEISNVTEEVVSISGMTNRSFDILRSKNVLLENKFQEISNNQSNIVSTLNQISKYYKVKYYKVVFLFYFVITGTCKNFPVHTSSFIVMNKKTHTSKILWIFLPEFPGPQKNKLVVFVAQLSREILISTNKIIVFDKDQLNEGRGFDPHTGVFTATARGIYTFSASIESTNCDVRGAIYRNNEQFAHIAGHFVDREGALGSATSYVHLDEGDRVWVQWMGELNGRVGHVQSQFAGHLLHEMDIWITDK